MALFSCCLTLVTECSPSSILVLILRTSAAAGVNFHFSVLKLAEINPTTWTRPNRGQRSHTEIAESAHCRSSPTPQNMSTLHPTIDPTNSTFNEKSSQFNSVALHLMRKPTKSCACTPAPPSGSPDPPLQGC